LIIDNGSTGANAEEELDHGVVSRVSRYVKRCHPISLHKFITIFVTCMSLLTYILGVDVSPVFYENAGDVDVLATRDQVKREVAVGSSRRQLLERKVRQQLSTHGLVADLDRKEQGDFRVLQSQLTIL